jgi:lysophospholipase L1-like esterase
VAFRVPDGIHFDARGHAAIGALMTERLQSLLAT